MEAHEETLKKAANFGFALQSKIQNQKTEIRNLILNFYEKGTLRIDRTERFNDDLFLNGFIFEAFLRATTEC